MLKIPMNALIYVNMRRRRGLAQDDVSPDFQGWTAGTPAAHDTHGSVISRFARFHTRKLNQAIPCPLN